MKIIFSFVFLILAMALFAQMPDQAQLRQTGKDLIEKMAMPIGEPLPQNVIKMGENIYQLKSMSSGMEVLTEVFYTHGNIVTGHGFINMTNYEEISASMFMTFCFPLSAYLGEYSLLNGLYSWNYGTKTVTVSSPQNRDGVWVVMILMVEK
jgi:hypothetical protein